jgi:hypothetical protein
MKNDQQAEGGDAQPIQEVFAGFHWAILLWTAPCGPSF